MIHIIHHSPLFNLINPSDISPHIQPQHNNNNKTQSMIMKMVNAATLTRLIIIVSTATLLLQTTESNPIIHPTPPTMQPLCISQFALANHACASIPTFPFLPPSGHPPLGRPPPPPADLLNPSFVGSNPTNPQSQPLPHHHRHHHHHHLHPVDSLPKPQLGGGHHHHHHHENHHEETEAQRECCRWLRAVDDMCVCDLLVYLPVFLSRPVHDFTVVVDDECEVRFQCLGRRLAHENPRD